MPQGETPQGSTEERPQTWVDVVRAVREALTPAERDSVVAAARFRLAAMSARATGDVLAQLDTTPGPVALDAIEGAVVAVPQQFLAALADSEVTHGAAVTRFLDLNLFDRSDDGSDLRRSLRTIGRHTWRLLYLASADVLDTAPLGLLGEALLSYLGDLDRRAARSLQTDDKLTDYDHLIEALLTDEPDSEARMEELAADSLGVDWTLPTSIVVMRVKYHGTLPTLRTTHDILIQDLGNPALVICDAEVAAEVAAQIKQAAPGLRVAISLPMPPTQAAAADRWALRALALVDAGVIPPHPIVRCRDHVTHLWLHAEPMLRRQLTQELLTPLLAESSNSREILSETMLAWLESRDSAPRSQTDSGSTPRPCAIAGAGSTSSSATCSTIPSSWSP